MANDEPTLEPGHPPWEPFNAARVGGLVGAIIGVLVTIITPLTGPWPTLAGAAVVGSLAFWWARRGRLG